MAPNPPIHELVGETRRHSLVGKKNESFAWRLHSSGFRRHGGVWTKWQPPPFQWSCGAHAAASMPCPARPSQPSKLSTCKWRGLESQAAECELGPLSRSIRFAWLQSASNPALRQPSATSISLVASCGAFSPNPRANPNLLSVGG